LDTCLHVVSPGSRGLFHRAISESGGCTTHQDTAADAEAAAQQLVTTVGCSASPDPLRCLRQVPVAQLLNAGGSFNPIIDGSVLPDQPRALFAAGRFNKVPYILGSNSDEGTLFFIGNLPVTTEEQYLAALRNSYGDLAEQVADVYPPANFASPQDALVRAFGDAVLVCPTYDSARRAAANGADVYLYNFARPIPIKQLASLKLGATHGAEIAYVFGSLDPGSDEDRQIAVAMQGYWTRLAYNGNPNGAGAVVWPRYQDATDQRLNFDTAIAVLTGFRRPECEFWWGTYDQDFQ
jgi:para-nitrobenzyl esterase